MSSVPCAVTADSSLHAAMTQIEQEGRGIASVYASGRQGHRPDQ